MELLDGRTVERRVERAVSVEERRHNREEAGAKSVFFGAQAAVEPNSVERRVVRAQTGGQELCTDKG